MNPQTILMNMAVAIGTGISDPARMDSVGYNILVDAILYLDGTQPGPIFQPGRFADQFFAALAVKSSAQNPVKEVFIE